MNRIRKWALAGMIVTTFSLGLAACGGGDSGTTEEAAAPSKADADKPATGTLRLFAYDDTVTDEVPARRRPRHLARFKPRLLRDRRRPAGLLRGSAAW